jgi:hypothetical protein
MEFFQVLMLAGAVLGLALVLFGLVLVIKKFAGDIEINLKIGSLKTGSSGLAIVAFGLVFFFVCAVSEQQVEEKNQTVTAQKGEIAQRDQASQELIDRLVAALKLSNLDSEKAVLDQVLQGVTVGPADAAATTPAVAAAPAAGAKTPATTPPAPTAAKPATTTPTTATPAATAAAANPAFKKLTSSLLTGLVRAEKPEVISLLKSSDPGIGQHLSAIQAQPATR